MSADERKLEIVEGVNGYKLRWRDYLADGSKR